MATTKPEPAPPAVAAPLLALRPAPWNPRTISDERFQNLCRSIDADPDFLWRRPVLAQADGTIYAGNMRFRAAQHLGPETIPAIIEDIPDQLARERALRDTAPWGAWEEDELAALIARLRQEGSDVDLLGFGERELQQLLDSLDRAAALADPEEIPPLPEEPVTQPGDLWLLGHHRVLCGDATNPDDAARVMAREIASCVWTDPPYGVNYTGGTKKRLTIKNDTAEGLPALLRESFAAVDGVLKPGAAIYVAHPAGPGSVVFGEAFIAQSWRLHETLVWLNGPRIHEPAPQRGDLREHGCCCVIGAQKFRPVEKTAKCLHLVGPLFLPLVPRQRSNQLLGKRGDPLGERSKHRLGAAAVG
jgi:ParB-like chromosome segregation protein Spo0J